MNHRRFLSIFLLLSVVAFAQNDWQFHLTGGLVSPFNSTKGFSTLGKAQYNFSDQFSLFVQSGYLSYGNYYLNYEIGREQKRIADEFDHKVVPVSLGGRYTAVNSSSWHPFIEVEIGVSFYNYKTGDIIPNYDPVTNKLVQFDRINERDESKTIASFGAGFGLAHQITKNFGTEIGLKLNSNFDKEYSLLLGGRGTYTTIYWGFVFYLT